MVLYFSECFVDSFIYFLPPPWHSVSLGISMNKEQVARPVFYSRHDSIGESRRRHAQLTQIGP
jgi:hypothetical protein